MHIIAKSLFLYFRHKLIRTRVFVDKLSLILSKRIRAYLCAPFGLGRIFLSLLLILSLALQPVMGAISTSKGQEIVGYDYDELGQSRPITAYDDAKRKADQAYFKLVSFATFVPADTDALIAEGILTAVTGGLGNVIGGAGKGSIAAGKIDEAINSAIDVNRGVPTPIVVSRMPKELLRETSSGINLTADPNKTTTVLGNYGMDMQHVLAELEYPKTLDFGAKKGGFNVLNTPDSLNKNPDQFWNDYNKPFLDEAIKRGDNFPLATRPTDRVLNRRLDDGTVQRTGFGREYDYLTSKGYVYDPVTSTMVKP